MKTKAGKYRLEIYKMNEEFYFEGDSYIWKYTESKDIKGELLETYDSSEGQTLLELFEYLNIEIQRHYEENLNTLYLFRFYDTKAGKVYFNNYIWSRVVCKENYKQVVEQMRELEITNRELEDKLYDKEQLEMEYCEDDWGNVQIDEWEEDEEE